MSSCRATSKNKIFIYKERRSSLTLQNNDEVMSTRIVVDGCEVQEGIRCDYLHKAKEIEMYIELKGQDVLHAIAQIERTICLLSEDVRRQKKVSYIICSRSPLASTQIQKYDRQFREKYNSKLIIKSSPYTDIY